MRQIALLAFCFLVSASAVQVLFPLYNYPNWYDPPNYIWSRVAAASASIPIVAVINPASGPLSCATVGADYVQGLLDLSAGPQITIVGYVATTYGDKLSATVKAEIDVYFDSCYSSLSGIFFDEMSNHAHTLSYYQDLYNYVHSKWANAVVVTNPGATIPEVLLAASDITVIFENYFSQWQTYTPPKYLKSYPARRFAAIIHSFSGTQADREQALTLATTRRFGNVFLTEDGLPNPYDTIPTSWDAQIAYLSLPPPPLTPSVNNVVPGSGQITVGWDSFAAPIRWTRIQYRLQGRGSKWVGKTVVGSLSGTINGLAPGTYEIRIIAKSTSGSLGPRSDPYIVTV